MALTDTELAILDLERGWFKYAGRKDALIRERLGWSPTRYYMALNALVDRPEALAAEPMLVRRLLRVRDGRRAARTAMGTAYPDAPR